MHQIDQTAWIGKTVKDEAEALDGSECQSIVGLENV
jgi:hypothetical protein